MSYRALVGPAIVLSIASALLVARAGWLAAVAFVLMSAAWISAERRAARAKRALRRERERSRAAWNQAWQNALLAHTADELRTAPEPRELWRMAAAVLGRAMEASRVAVYRTDEYGVDRLWTEFACDEAAPPAPRALPARFFHEAELSLERPSTVDAPEPGAVALGLGGWRVVQVGTSDRVRLALAMEVGEEPRPFSDTDRRFVRRFGELAARLSSEASERNRQGRAIHRGRSLLGLAGALVAARDAESVVDAALRVGARLAGARRSVLFTERDGEGFSVAAERGFGEALPPSAVRRLLPRVEESVRRRAVVQSGAVEGALDPEEAPRLFAPLFHGRELLGVLLLEAEAGRPAWDDDALETVSRISDLVAEALETVRILEAERTSARSLERQLRESQKLEVAGTLAGGLAHDLNNVLGGILGYASVLRTHVGDRPVAARCVDTIERSALQGAELTGRLLSLTRKRPARRAAVSLNGVVQETFELLAHTIDRRIRIEKRLDPGVGTMLADASELHQIVLNLCLNARDAMPEGGVLRVATRVEPSGDRVRLTVTDSGVGMDSRTLERLFEPRFSTKGEGGTGLGLSVVYGLVQSLGGDIRVSSSPGRGSRFDVFLPCEWVEEASPAGVPELERRGRGELVLIVDDESVLRELGREILESHGYRVEAFADGEDAYQFVRHSKERVSLVILDLVMPGIDGSETLRRLRLHDAALPILLSSGLTTEESIHALRAQGATGFLGKPYGMADLIRAVAAALEESAAPPAALPPRSSVPSSSPAPAARTDSRGRP